MYQLTKHFIEDSLPRLKNALDIKLTQEFARQLRNFDSVPQAVLFRNEYKKKWMIIAKVDGNVLVFCINPETKVIITAFSVGMYAETVADEINKYRRNMATIKKFMEKHK